MEDMRVNRRRFVAGGGSLAAAAIFAPGALAEQLAGRRVPTLRGGSFSEGVISGDPTPRGITLWTRLHDVAGRGTVELEVARDRAFRLVVDRRVVPTSGDIGHSVKARVAGLRPYEQYYYRFATRDENSPVGRFRTALPPDSRQPVRFAFFSCQDFTFGYYNALEAMAREDVDFVINLGDYIYAEAYHSRGSSSGGVRTDPIGLAESLDRVPPQVRALPQRPGPAQDARGVPDDHDLGRPRGPGQLRRRRGDRGGLPATRFTGARQRAGYRAFFESMPTYPTRAAHGIYHATRFGRNVDLLCLDERQYRDDQPCGDPALGPECEGSTIPGRSSGASRWTS